MKQLTITGKILKISGGREGPEGGWLWFQQKIKDLV